MLSTLGLATLLMIGRPARFLSGGDVSEIPEVEANGLHFFYQGKTEDPFVIFKKAGWTWVRFRVWNQPKDGFCDLAHTLALAKRAHAQGLKVSIDFHYSDWWADPGKQTKPRAWKDLSFTDLEEAVYRFTRASIDAFVKQGTPPFMVQVGNEITPGMLWPDGKVDNDNPESWKRLATLIRAGVRGVKAGGGKNQIKTLLHLDRGGNQELSRWWFDNLAKQKVDFDAIGLSYYPPENGSLSALQANLNELATRYQKDVYVVETAQFYTGSAPTLPEFPATPTGQAKLILAIREVLQKVPHHRGRGLLYWAPAWISPTTFWPEGQKSPNPLQTRATFDRDGNALPAVDALGTGKQ